MKDFCWVLFVNTGFVTGFCFGLQLPLTICTHHNVVSVPWLNQKTNLLRSITESLSFLDSEFLSQQYPSPHLLFMTPGKFIFLHCKSRSNTRIYHLQHDPEIQKTEEKKRKKSQKHKKHEKKNQNQKSKQFLDQIWFLSSWVQLSLESCFDF